MSKHPAISLKRFSWIADGAELGPDPLCDVPVRISNSAVALPTVGSIVPNWVLAVPRRCALSIAAIPSAERRALLSFAKDVARDLGPAESTFYFEHGPAHSASVVGCGVDQAHLHVLNTPLDFSQSALNDQTVEWTPVSHSDPWADQSGTAYYLLKTQLDTYIGKPKAAVSQFFRKHIARAAGIPNEWDYKVWPHYDNIRRTYERFREHATTSRAD